MKDTLIIGSQGYIGSALYGKLQDRSIGVDINGGEICINYGQLTKKEISKYKNIVLLAASAGVKPCEGDIKYSFKNNVSNFIQLLSKIKNYQKFIYASSGSIYGDIGGQLASEDCNTLESVSYYDLTKKINDMYASLSNIEYYGLRFGTVNGKTQYSNIIRDDVIINSMVKNAIINKKIKSINPSVSRGILGLNDLCNAIEIIINTSNDNRGIYNMASFNCSVKEISDYVSNRFLCNVETKEDDSSKMYDFKLNTEKFCNRYNFTFKDSIENISDSLLDNFEIANFIRRDKCLKI